MYKRQKENKEKDGSRKVRGAQCDLMCPSRLLVTSMAGCLVPIPYPRGLVAAVNSLIFILHCLSVHFLYSVRLNFHSGHCALVQIDKEDLIPICGH